MKKLLLTCIIAAFSLIGLTFAYEPTATDDAIVRKIVQKLQEKNYWKQKSTTHVLQKVQKKYDAESKMAYIMQQLVAKMQQHIQNGYRYTQGNENATIMLVEYTDVQCPFCKKQYENTTMQTLVQNYSGAVAYTVRHFPLAFHKDAEKVHQAIECVADQKGNQGFFTYIQKLFDSSVASLDDARDVAEDMKVSLTTFDTCMSSEKYATKIQKDMQEGQVKYAINGTPSVVIYNTKTDQRDTVVGAYPYEEFAKKIDALLQK